MDKEKIKVAVIGAGGWGYQHARVFSSRRDTELCSITGRTEAKTKERAEVFKTRYYLDIDEMLKKEQPDMVSLCLPGQGTYEATLKVIEAGVPLLVEKPLAYTLKEAEALINEAEKRKLFFAINFNHRYSKPAQLAKEDIGAGNLGEVIFSSWRFGHGGAWPGSHPHVNLIEAQCHGFDMLEYLCGPIESIMAEMTNMTTGSVYSTVAFALRFINGAVGTFIGTFDASDAYPLSQFIEINGTKGRILIEDSVKKYTFQQVGNEKANVWQAGFFNDQDREFAHNFDNHVEDLLKAFVNKKQPPVHASCGLRALKLAHAAIESYETGKRIQVL